MFPLFQLPKTKASSPNLVVSALVLRVVAAVLVVSLFAGRPSWPNGQIVSPNRPASCAAGVDMLTPFLGDPAAGPPY